MNEREKTNFIIDHLCNLLKRVDNEDILTFEISSEVDSQTLEYTPIVEYKIRIRLGGDCISKETGSCNHDWVYSNSIYTTYPAQRDRICKLCGKKECIRLDEYEDPNEFDRIVEKFKEGN